VSVRVEQLQRAAWTRASAPKTVGLGGIALGLLALWLALPPFGVRTAPAPVAVGILGAGAGIWVISRREARIGWIAVVLSVVGIAGALLAMRASSSNLEGVFVWSALIAATLRYATPLTFAAIGGMFSERSGVVNIGLEGMMLMGAFFGAYGADQTGSWVGGLFIGVLSGALLALVHAIFSIHLRADQIVIGTAINFLALGITGYLYNQHYGNNGTPNNLPAIPDVNLNLLSHIPPHGFGNFLYESIGQLNLMVWLALALLPISYVAMFKTPLGLRIRSVGEHPKAADTLGISVYRTRYGAVTLSGALAALGGVFLSLGVRYASVIVSGVLSALGGAYLSIGFNHNFSEGMTNGRGFIALAALIFGGWRPFGAFSAALLFGFSSALAQRLPDLSASESAAWPVLFQTLPYVLTLIAVAGVIGRSIPPAAVGRPYVKQ
jgi:general nucleoside transport system permease protein